MTTKGMKLPHVNLVVLGHVDGGKSVLCGQILVLSGQVDKRTLEKCEKEAKEKQAALDNQEKGRQARERQAALDSQEKERQVKERLSRELAAQNTRTALAQISLEVREARLLLGDASRRQPLPDEAAKSRSDLEAVVGEAQRAGPATKLSDLERLRKRLGNSRANLRMALNRAPAVSPPAPERTLPAALLEGAVAYFQGNYEKAARTLEDAEFPDPRATAQLSV